MKRWFKWLTLGLTALLFCGGAALVLLYRASQQVPDFYRNVSVQAYPETQQIELRDELERRVLNLHNQTRHSGQWQAEFTEDQLNAWLATQLPQQFPKMMPRGTRDPRVKLTEDRVQAGCRWQRESLESVVSMEAEVYLTETPNQLAIRLLAVRAGRVPLPLGQLLDRISLAARRGGLDLTWGQEQGDPVALVQIPTRHESYRLQELHVSGVEVQEGRVLVVGLTERVPEANEDSPQLGLSGLLPRALKEVQSTP